MNSVKNCLRMHTKGLGVIVSRIFGKSPSDEWVINERFQHCHDRIGVFLNKIHHSLGSDSEHAINSRSIQSVHELASESKRDFFGEAIPGSGDVEAITEVDVDDLTCLLFY